MVRWVTSSVIGPFAFGTGDIIRKHRTDDVVRAKCFRVVECLVEIVRIERQMRARTNQARIVDELAKLLGRAFAESGGFHFAVADRAQCLERAGCIGLHRIVDGIQLDADRFAEWIGDRHARERCGGDGETGVDKKFTARPHARSSATIDDAVFFRSENSITNSTRTTAAQPPANSQIDFQSCVVPFVYASTTTPDNHAPMNMPTP